MLFNSLTFLVFFLVVLCLYYAQPWWQTRKLTLLTASYLFYAAWNPPFVFLLLFSTTVDWVLARRMDASDSLRVRRWLLIGSLCSNLGLLGFFKYGDFLAQNFSLLLLLLGIQYQPPPMGIILPVGISFYTFQSLSYTLDVYRRNIRADAGFLDFALFVSFFPQLVAGPIVRAAHFLPQLAGRRSFNANRLAWGLCLLLFGLFQKVVLADNLFAPVVDYAWSDPIKASSVELWAAVFGFSGQIFYDFAGYSLCAIGAALCLGFELPDNFRYPYAARGFSDFWRRWHISLSSWLRDYLYISLGGNRGAALRVYINLMLTMLIGGLWHGASWLFVLWGGLHGLYLAVERKFKSDSGARTETGQAWGLVTFSLVTLTWIPFRATDVSSMQAFLSGLITFSPTTVSLHVVLVFVGVVGTLYWQQRFRHGGFESWFVRQGNIAQGALLGCCMALIFLYSGGDERAFIYFQF